VYAAAVESGLGPEDLIEGLGDPIDASNASWTPDDEHVDEDVLTLREGLRLSSNRAAVQLLTTGRPQTDDEAGEEFRLRRSAGRAVVALAPARSR
jgi:membrane carboxypeptidase/penicillin-binding protein